jgi:REP element-mobilizing transposase RayT
VIHWYHLIITGYGFWLPNDPRGSWSDVVGAWELYKFGGAATKTNERRSLAHDPHDAQLRRAAKALLKYPPVRFDARQRESIGVGFAQAIEEAKYRVKSLCIGHDHAHLIIGRHERSIEQIARHLKSKATMALTRAGIHPLRDHRKRDGSVPTPWSVGEWKVFINDVGQLMSAIAYVERHPGKEGLAPTTYPFIVAPLV